MADPATMAGVSLASTVAGTAFNAFGARRQGQSQASVYRYQAGIAELNKQIALQNRDYALQAGESEAMQYGVKAAQREGGIKAAQSASGFDVDFGSSVDVQESQRSVTEMDNATIRKNAARVAYGFLADSEVSGAQAGLYRLAADNAIQGGNLAALGSLISGAGSVSDKWLNARRYGLFG